MSAARRRTLARAAWAAAALLLVLPGAAGACPMCLSGQGGGTGKAFAIGSFFLSVTPLAVIGTAVWYLRRRARAIEGPDARVQGERAVLPVETSAPR